MKPHKQMGLNLGATLINICTSQYEKQLHKNIFDDLRYQLNKTGGSTEYMIWNVLWDQLKENWE